MKKFTVLLALLICMLCVSAVSAQTKEAVVLMMADACESASRTLVEPTPARVQNLVRSISQERLEDEQFDESGITLTELRTIEASIVKSLISLHHGRIKYPEKIEKKR